MAGASAGMRLGVLLLGGLLGAVCQQHPQSGPLALGAPAVAPAGQSLAVHDQVMILTSDVEGLGDRPFRVEPDGTVNLPLVGRLRASGLTVEEFEKELLAQLALYLRAPRATVKRLEARAETVLVAGAFRNPGLYTLSERRSLLEVLSAAGGLLPAAAQTIKITRRLDGVRRPLPSAVEDPEAGLSTAVFNVNRLIASPARRDEILIEPDDVLFAGPAGLVFVTGEVLRPGTFELAERESFGVTELILMAGGLGRDAAPHETRILRPILNGSRRAEIPVDVKSILDGRAADFRVLSNDMVVVPRGRGKARALRGALLFAAPAAISSVLYLTLRR